MFIFGKNAMSTQSRNKKLLNNSILVKSVYLEIGFVIMKWTVDRILSVGEKMTPMKIRRCAKEMAFHVDLTSYCVK